VEYGLLQDVGPGGAESMKPVERSNEGKDGCRKFERRAECNKP
jgi:hypothetical protein